MTLTVIYRADQTINPNSKPYHIVVHEDVPKSVAVHVAEEFASYKSSSCKTGTVGRFGFKTFETDSGRQRLVVDYEQAAAIHGADEGAPHPPVWRCQQHREDQGIQRDQNHMVS